jgi:hypothetical protein
MGSEIGLMPGGDVVITRVLTYFILANFSCRQMLIGRYNRARVNRGDGVRPVTIRAELDVIQSAREGHDVTLASTHRRKEPGNWMESAWWLWLKWQV